MAPAPAAATGRNSRSHSDPPPFAAATMPVKSRAAATGVPNSAPTVAAPAMSTAICAGTCGSSRANSATAMRDVDRDDRVLGAEAHAAGEAEDGHEGEARAALAARSGGAMSSVVAESGPPWPGRTAGRCRPRDPVRVRISTIHQPFGSTPSASGRVSHSTPLEQVGQLLEGPQEQRREGADDDRRDRE